MKVAVYYSNNDVRIEERGIPETGEGEILISMRASGICGSDVMEWYRKGKGPLVLGHEVAGDVVRVGKRVKNLKEGDRVVVAHHVPCNTCYYCLNGHHTVCETLRRTNLDPGGFAEFIRVPEINVDRGVFKFGEEISYEEASFTEPLACVVRAHRLLKTAAGESIFVLGCGTAGLLHIKFAKTIGAGRIFAMEPLPIRREFAMKAGADYIIEGKEEAVDFIRSRNEGRLADIVILSTGSQEAVELAFSTVERGGRILFFATPDPSVTVSLPLNRLFWRTEISLLSSYGGSPADYARALELIQRKKVEVKDLITHRLPLSEAQRGFSLVADGRECVKVILFS